MAYATGTATDFNDLLNKLISFLTTNPALVAAGQQYEVVHDATVAYPNMEPAGQNRRHVCFKSKGLSGLDEIYTAISTRSNTANDYYNWRVQAGTGFFAANLPAAYADLSQGAGLTNPCPEPKMVNLWNQSTPYWFFANGRRWWVVAKVSTNYMAGGAGFILPPCEPAQFPYPIACFGCHSQEAKRWSDTSWDHQGLATGRPWLRMPSGEWEAFQGWERRESQSSNYSNDRQLLPTGVRVDYTTSGYTEWSYRRMQNVRDNLDGTFQLFPVSFAVIRNVSANSPQSVSTPFGEADGLFWIPTLNNGAEDVVTISGVQYIVFQSVFRSSTPYLFALRAD